MFKKLSFFLILFASTFHGQTIPVDPTFNAGEIGPNGRVNDFVGLSDGKIIIVGNFTEYNGIPMQCIARINADGSLDSTFNPGIGAKRNDGSTPFLSCVELAPDGKILIGGNFEKYNGQQRKILVRLNTNGSFDTTFNIGTIFDSYDPMDNGIHDIEITNDNKILACGSINIVRLNNDGSHDTSFVSHASGSILDYVTKVKELEDGKLIVGGWNLLGSGFGRLNPDGSVDETFAQYDFLIGNVNDFYVEDNGKILVGGVFFNEAYFFLLRLNEDGTFDDSFVIHEFAEVQGQPNSGVYCISKYHEKTLVSGLFDSFGAAGINDIALINDDGSVDESFNTGSWPSRYIRSLFVQNETNIIVGPQYQTWQEPVNVPSLMRFGDGVMNNDVFSLQSAVLVYNDINGINVKSTLGQIKNIRFFNAAGMLVVSENKIQKRVYSFKPDSNGLYFGAVELDSGEIFKIKSVF